MWIKYQCSHEVCLPGCPWTMQWPLPHASHQQTPQVTLELTVFVFISPPDFMSLETKSSSHRNHVVDCYHHQPLWHGQWPFHRCPLVPSRNLWAWYHYLILSLLCHLFFYLDTKKLCGSATCSQTPLQGRGPQPTPWPPQALHPPKCCSPCRHLLNE